MGRFISAKDQIKYAVNQGVNSFLGISNGGSTILWLGLSLIRIKKDPDLYFRVRKVLDYALEAMDASSKQVLDSAEVKFQAIDRRDLTDDDFDDDESDKVTMLYSGLTAHFYGSMFGLAAFVPLAPFYFAGELLYNWKKDNLRPPKTPLEETAERLTEKPGTAKPGDDLLLQYAQP